MTTPNTTNSIVKNRDIFDRFVLVLGIIESLTTLPQIYEIWFKNQTVGVSAITWFSYCLIECVWVTYGIKQRDKAIIASSLSWGIMELIVAVGAVVK